MPDMDGFEVYQSLKGALFGDTMRERVYDGN
jgi:hypothetical protein